jgi:hypothetical protein
MTEAAMKRSLICFCFLMILGQPGYSQPAKAPPAFYIVLNSLAKTCTVVDKVPRTDTPNTRAEAETAIKTLTPCNPRRDARVRQRNVRTRSGGFGFLG